MAWYRATITILDVIEAESEEEVREELGNEYPEANDIEIEEEID